MPVFDFNSKPAEAETSKAEKTYELYYTDAREADAAHPIMILENRTGALTHHSDGMFLTSAKGTGFTMDGESEKDAHDILKMDARFEHLVHWLGDSRIMVRLSGTVTTATMQYTRSRRPALLYAAQSFPEKTDSFSL